MPFVLVKQ
jgi:regulator of protease activity HflC (stomatin/prohibitin superfamily)